jgi:hypothetical protein
VKEMAESDSNKFDLINKVLVSELGAQDKCLLIELIVRDGEGGCYPSVKRLCKARGIQHQKNFKGVDSYLPGLVTKRKGGRKNFYTLNRTAIMQLPEAGLTEKETPSLSGVNPPSPEDNNPSQAENNPWEGGANTSFDTSKNSSLDTDKDLLRRSEELKESFKKDLSFSLD